MLLDVIAVETLPDYRLLLTFENNEQKYFDMKPYLNATVLTTYQFLITSQNVGKGRSFCRHRMRRRNPRLNKETKLR